MPKFVIKESMFIRPSWENCPPTYLIEFRDVVGRIMFFSKGVHVVIFGSCKYIILHGKRDFVDVMKVKNLEMGDCFGLLSRANLITRVLKSRKIFSGCGQR